jgi:hypothetical protein
MPCVSWLEEPPSTTKDTIWFLRSEDLGRSWRLHGSMKRPPTNEALSEPSIVKLPDGRLLMLVRSYVSILEEPDGSLVYRGSRYYYLALSQDNGKTWGEPWPCYLGSERWNGAMAEMCLLGDHLYIVGSFSQFQPPDFSGLKPHWEEGTQRTPLLLLRVPLEQVDAKRTGAYILEPDAIRPLGISLNLRTRLSGTYASMQMEVLRDGTLGIMCDSHTHAHEEGNVFFWRVDPGWVADGPPHALWRGPIPLVTEDGEIRVLHTQTTIRPTHFPIGRLPLEISFTLRPHNFERGEEVIHPLFTIWNTADLATPSTAYPHAIFASLDVQTTLPKDGPCSFMVNTGQGRYKLDIAAISERDYHVRFCIHSRLEWSLWLDGKEVGRFHSVAPGLPGSYTLCHEMYPGRDIDVGFRDINVDAASGTMEPLEHPFLLERFTPDGRTDDRWRGSLEHIILMRDQNRWRVSLKGTHWSRWLRFGGLAIQVDEGGETEWVSLEVDGKKRCVLRGAGSFVECLEGSRLENIRLELGERRLAGLAASALHERTYLCANHASTCGQKGSLAPYADAEEVVMDLSDSVRSMLVVGWDTSPASMLRLLQSFPE